LAVLGVAAFPLAVFHLLAGDQPWPVLVLVGLLGAALVVVPGWQWMRRLVRVLTFGPVRARFERFPFYVGEALEIGLDCRGGFGRLHDLTVTLRFIRVASERVGREQRAVHYQHWIQSHGFAEDQLG